MLRHFFLLSLSLLAAADPIITGARVQRINAGNHSWVAHNPETNPLRHLSTQQLQGLMGLRSYHPLAIESNASNLGLGSIPTSFDARTKWPSCQQPIRDQASCGSCWAFAAAETLTDNLCVLGSTTPVLSPQELVSCDTADHGCSGGTLMNVWDYIDSKGLVADDCMPYESGTGKNSTCALPGCTAAGSSTAYKCPVEHTMLDSDAAIQAAVMTVGAVEVGFTVMEDFMNYKSGIYHYTEGLALGGHAVKIVGWGKELETFYWIVQNSWGAAWGESGYFRIENWHQDKESAIAIGGGFACVQGNQPAPPAPPTPPETCKDIVSYCKDYDQAKCKKESYIVPVCKKTCGCCSDVLKPSYCPKDGQ